MFSFTVGILCHGLGHHLLNEISDHTTAVIQINPHKNVIIRIFDYINFVDFFFFSRFLNWLYSKNRLFSDFIDFDLLNWFLAFIGYLFIHYHLIIENWALIFFIQYRRIFNNLALINLAIYIFIHNHSKRFQF